MEKQQMKHQKAEQIRNQHESFKKDFNDKVRQRQERVRHSRYQVQNEKIAKLESKINLGRERKEKQIQQIQIKAQEEIQKIEETNFIMSMTRQNQKLDIDNKMREIITRRNKILKNNEIKRQSDLKRKSEAFTKKRLEMERKNQQKLQQQEEKRLMAQERRNNIQQNKKKRKDDDAKRELVLKRKNFLDEKFTDIMSFLSNSDLIWEMIGRERDWQNLASYVQEEDIFALLQKDQFELEKLALKKDAEIINKIIIEDENGNMYRSNIQENQDYIKYLQGQSIHSSQSSDIEDSVQDSSKWNISSIQNVDDDLGATSNKEENCEVNSANKSNSQKTNNDQKEFDIISLGADDDISTDNKPLEVGDLSSLQTDTIKDGQTSNQQSTSYNLQNGIQCDENALLFDEHLQFQLYQQKLLMSMRRNVLKKSLSEDLNWAECMKQYDNLQNSNHQQSEQILTHHHSSQRQQNFEQKLTRSMHSTPERKKNSDKKRSSLIDDELDDSINILKPRKEDSHPLYGSGHNPNKNVSIVTQNLKVSQQSLTSSRIKRKRINSGTSDSIIGADKQQSGGKHSKDNDLSNSKRNMMKTSLGAMEKDGGSSKEQNIIDSQSRITNTGVAATSLKDTHRPRGSGLLNQGKIDGLIAKDSKNILNSSGGLSLCAENLNKLFNEDKIRKRTQSLSAESSGGENNHDKDSRGSLSHIQIIENEDQQKNNNVSDQSNNLNSSLITDNRPTSSIISSQLSSRMVGQLSNKNRFSLNASKILFPLKQQTLLLKKTKKDQKFLEARVSLKLDDIQLYQKNLISQNIDTSLSLSHQNTSETKDHNPPTNTSDHKPQNQPNTEDTTQSKPYNPDSKSIDNIPLLQDTSNNQTQLQSQSQQNIDWLSQQANIEQKQEIIKNQINSSSTSTNENKVEDNKEKSNIVWLSQNNVVQNQIVESNGNAKNDLDKKELIIKLLLNEYLSLIKVDENIKTVMLDNSVQEIENLIQYLEENEVTIKYCRICEAQINNNSTIINNSAGSQVTVEQTIQHIQSKTHRQVREELGIKEIEDHQYSILSFVSFPGDIQEILQKEKEKALKRKAKKIKMDLNSIAVQHENASSYPLKDVYSQNRRAFQILCFELEKLVVPSIKDYQALDKNLKDIIKLLDKKQSADLHLMRKLKFIPILIDVCKRISTCQKSDMKYLGQTLEFVIKIILKFCVLKENKNYMLQTNRMQHLIELLIFCLNRKTELFFGIKFLPQLLQVIIMHIKHRVPFECQQIKELFIDFLICQGFITKLKGKFSIINYPMVLNDEMGQVPIFLLRSAAFLEALTQIVCKDSWTRPVYERSSKIGEHVFFVIQNTSSFGIIDMITTILLNSNELYKVSETNKTQKVMPQTIVSLTITCIKILNNLFRMDFRFMQGLINDQMQTDQMCHLFNFLLVYTSDNIKENNIDSNDDCKELLHETILLIGYFSLLNEKNIQMLQRGENTILQKLCNLPFPYFCDKKLKDILFPTLICASYKNERSLNIIDLEISLDLLVKFLKNNINEESLSITDNTFQTSSKNRSSRAKSPSVNSTTSSQCSVHIDMMTGNSPFIPLFMRFPKKLWAEAQKFYQSIL